MPDTKRVFSRDIKRFGCAMGIALVAMVVVVPAAGATVITVSTPGDEFQNGGSNCSLREAVEAANTNQPKDVCPAGEPGAFDGFDFIDVPMGTYTLAIPGVGGNSVGDLDVTDTNLTIRNVGGGQTTINGNTAVTGDRVLEIAASASAVGITGIRVTGGSTTANGGGIANSAASLGLTNVTLDGNSAAGGGGGIFSGAGTTLSLANVTVSGNSTTLGEGGGILYNSANNSFFKNSTIVSNVADNSVSGGIANLNGTGIVNISNTILADNNGGGEPGDCSGVVNSSGHNIVGTTTGCTFTPLAGGSDLVGAPQAEVPANLGALADNGGTVLTRLPTRLSPAINRGYPGSGGGTTCEPTDARGMARPQEGRCDIGAVEVVQPGPQAYAVTTTGDEFDGVFFGTSCSLREAVTAANKKQATGGCPAGAGGTVTNTIQLAPGTYTLTRSGVDDTNVLGDLDLLSNGLTIAPTGTVGQTTIDGAAAGDRVVQAHPGVIANVINAVNIRNGSTAGNGGGVESAGDLYLRTVTVSGNSAGGDGGGVHYTSSASGDINNSTVSGNQANGNGGGMFSADGLFPFVSDVTVTQNTADANLTGAEGGGGLGGFAGFQLSNTIVAGNTDASGGDSPDCNTPVSHGSAGYNLIGNANNCNLVAGTGDQVGTSGTPIAAGLGGLADNGGRTLTHAPVLGSAALNLGNPGAPGSPPLCLPSDQRGVARPLAGRCDVGSVEIDPAPPVINTPQPVINPPTTSPPPATGLRAAALQKCKKQFRKHQDQKKFSKCKKRARQLPV